MGAKRSFMSDADVFEIPLLVPLAGICSYLTFRALFGFLSLAHTDLVNTHQALVILQRMASGHHSRRVRLKHLERHLSRGSTRILNIFPTVKQQSVFGDLDCGVAASD